MAYRTKNQNTLSLGSWNVECDRCGFKFKNDDILIEWTGLQVCHDCWEPRHPMDFFRGFADDQDVPYTRPDSPETGGIDINGNPFPPTYTGDSSNTAGVDGILVAGVDGNLIASIE